MQIGGFQNSIFSAYTSRLSGGGLEPKEGIPSPPGPASDSPPGKNELLSKSFSFATRETPTAQVSGPLSSLRVSDAIDFLAQKPDPAPFPAIINLDKSVSFTELKIRALGDVKLSLTDLGKQVSNLLQEDSLNTRQAKSSDPSLIDVTAGRQSPLGNFAATPSRTSSSNVRVSDEQSTPLGQLGLSGTFNINGVDVTVESTDSIVSIRDKINYGEDQNFNGALDPAEDINENNQLDRYGIDPSEFGPGVFIIEDLNGNGALDPSEDTDGNSRLDGGVNDTLVLASIQGNRLVLTSLAGGSTGIDLQDDNSVLLSLGFFELDSKGLPILKEQQLNFDTPPKNLNVSPNAAELELDGQKFSSNTNFFKDVLTDTTLEIKKSSTQQVDINTFIDAGNAAGQIRALTDSFNNTIQKINQVLAESLELKRDPELQSIRTELKNNSQKKIREIGAGNETIDIIRANAENRNALGLESVNTQKNGVQEISVTRTVQAIKDGLTRPFKSTEKKLFNQLTSIGIRTAEDDTIKVDGPRLERALTLNADAVLDLFLNPENGILPKLDNQLSRLLKDDLGDIDLKQDKLVVQSESPSDLEKRFQSFVENLNLQGTVKNLIAVA